MKPIITPRLVIREYRAGDEAAYSRLSAECFDAPQTDAQAGEFIAWSVLNCRRLEMIHQPPYGDYLIALADTGEPVGSVGIVPSIIPWDVLSAFRGENALPTFLVSPEFGLFWAVYPAFQGRGFATEAASAVIDWLFTRLQVRQVVATTEHKNFASQRVMQKLGMTLHANPGKAPFWFEVVGLLINR